MSHPSRRMAQTALAVLVTIGAGTLSLALLDPADGRAHDLHLAQAEGWQVSFKWPAPLGEVAAVVAIDLNEDGVDEVVVAMTDGAIHAFRTDGTLVWETQVSGTIAGAAGLSFDGKGYVAVASTRTVSELLEPEAPGLQVPTPAVQAAYTLLDADGSEWATWVQNAQPLAVLAWDIEGDGDDELAAVIRTGDGTRVYALVPGRDSQTLVPHAARYVHNGQSRGWMEVSGTPAGPVTIDIGRQEVQVPTRDNLYTLRIEGDMWRVWILPHARLTSFDHQGDHTLLLGREGLWFIDRSTGARPSDGWSVEAGAPDCGVAVAGEVPTSVLACPDGGGVRLATFNRTGAPSGDEAVAALGPLKVEFVPFGAEGARLLLHAYGTGSTLYTMGADGTTGAAFHADAALERLRPATFGTQADGDLVALDTAGSILGLRAPPSSS